ncbi:hypothetical protein CW304_26330 [Bacillus sp. UFRGS-B20]|nr:hypothetical protein CW304_26330 [Bacillus sp. UFRGS-B20]
MTSRPLDPILLRNVFGFRLFLQFLQFRTIYLTVSRFRFSRDAVPPTLLTKNKTHYWVSYVCFR